MIRYTGTKRLKDRGDLIQLRREADTEIEYFYVDRRLYDVCVIMSDRYSKSISMLKSLVPDNKHDVAVEYFFEVVPEPLRMLAPFLQLCSADVDLDLLSLEELCGYLHVVTNAVDPLIFLKASPSIRLSMDFKSYELIAYKEIYASVFARYGFDCVESTEVSAESEIASAILQLAEVLKENKVSMPMIPSGIVNFVDSTVPEANTVSPSVAQVETSSVAEAEEEEEEEEDPMANIFAELNSFVEEQGWDKEEVEEKEPEVKESANEEKDRITELARLYGGV